MLFPDPKPGDEVAYYRNYHGNEPRKLTIDRVTPAQIVVSGTRFRRSDGEAVGGGRWNRTHVKPWTPAIDEAIAKAAAEKRTAEHLREVWRRGQAAMDFIRDRCLDETQAQAAEDLVLEVERRVNEILGLPCAADDAS